jgi:anaerobic magnesium-protoporphyrin IX monomethyl ester cyclase
MPKIVFVYPRWTDSYGLFAHFGRRAGRIPPINLAIMAAIAEREGYEAKIYDGEVNGWSNEYLIDKVMQDKPDILAFGGMTPFFHRTTDFIEKVRKAGFKGYILVGGPHITIVREQGFMPEMDIIFVGSAMKGFPAVLKYYLENKVLTPEFLSAVQGLIYRDCGVVKSTGEELFGKSLDDRPMPARHLLENEKYKFSTTKGRKIFTIIQTTRGCPWHCVYCASEALQTTTVSRRSVKLVVDEIEECVKKYNISHFYVVDDELTLKYSYTAEICNEIIRRGLKITIEGQTRADLVNQEIAELLVKAGLIRMAFGLETAVEPIREIIKKKVPLESHNTANDIFQSLGVETANSIMLGLPGDTVDTVLETINWVANNRKITHANFAITTPYPGTELHDMAMNGDYGLHLKTKDYSQFIRYGFVVMYSNELSPEQLLKLQNYGFAKIYSKPWRWKTEFKKFGLIGMILQVYRYITAKAWKEYERI